MSTIKVDTITDEAGTGAPDFPNGIGVTGTVTATSFAGDGSALTGLPSTFTSVSVGTWTVSETAGVLLFATGGVNKMKLDASGNITTVGDITAFGTV